MDQRSWRRRPRSLSSAERRRLKGSLGRPAFALGGDRRPRQELSTKEEMFHGVRHALKPFLDTDKILTQLILIPVQPSLELVTQAVNNVIMLKHYVNLIKPVFDALTGSRSSILQEIRALCTPESIETIQQLIDFASRL